MCDRCFENSGHSFTEAGFFEGTEPLRKNVPNCSCGVEKAADLHTCPMSEQIYGDKTPCGCCEACTKECAESAENPSFEARMLFELQANAHKGDWRAFAKPENRLEILEEIAHHLAKLGVAVSTGDEELIKEHSADIGNIAMFMYESTKVK